jgi:hypothetical protein
MRFHSLPGERRGPPDGPSVDAGIRLVHANGRVRQSRAAIACGIAERFPGVPEVNRNWPMAAAVPAAQIADIAVDELGGVADDEPGDL